LKSSGHFHNASWGGFVALMKACSVILCCLLAVKLLGMANYGKISTWLSFFLIYLSFNSSVFTVLVVKLQNSSNSGSTVVKSNTLRKSAVYITYISLSVLALITIILSAYRKISNSDLIILDQILDLDILLMGAITSIQILVSLQSAIIEGAGRLDLATKFQLPGPFLLLISLFYLHITKDSLDTHNYLLLIFTACFTELISLALARLHLGLINTRVGRDEDINFYTVQKMLRSGWLLQATSLLNFFLEPMNKILINYFTGPGNVAIYDLAMKVIWGIHHLVGSAMRVFVHIGSQKKDKLGELFAKSVNLLWVPIIMIHAIGVSFLYMIAVYWLNHDAATLIIFFGIATLSNLGMIFISPLYLSLIGSNDLKFIFRTQLILALINLLVSSLAIPTLGLIGSALGLLIASIINVKLIYNYCRKYIVVYIHLERLIKYEKLRFGISILLMLFTFIIVFIGGDYIFLLPLIAISFVYMIVREPLSKRILDNILSNRSIR